MLMAGDIGNTQTALRLFEPEREEWRAHVRMATEEQS